MSAYTIGNKLGKNLPFTILGAAIIVGLIGWDVMREKPVEAPRVISAAEQVKLDQEKFQDQAFQAIYTGVMNSAVNPKAVQLGSWTKHANGYCATANMPNTYGGYEGPQRICYLKINGNNVFTVNGVAK